MLYNLQVIMLSSSQSSSFLLQFSSLCFCAPLATSWDMEHSPVFRYGLALVIMTSWLYHGNYGNKRIRRIDILVSHFMIAYHLAWGAFICRAYTWRVCAMMLAVLYSSLIHYCFKVNKTNTLSSIVWHSTIHIALATGSLSLLSEPQCSVPFISFDQP